MRVKYNTGRFEENLFYCLTLDDADEEYKPIRYCMGFPLQIVSEKDTVSNTLYVTEKIFDNEKELLQDIENFRNAPDPVYTEIFNDIFGDG